MSEELEQIQASYREGDTQFQLAGGEAGCMKLSNDFYDQMEILPEAKHILSLHPADLTESRKKFGLFLCGYLNGPERYEQEYGPIQLAPAHSHIPIGTDEKEAWLLCMKKALELQTYPETFKNFLMKRFAIPAERCRNRP
ncbi:MAG: group II truncated hemoglobin [Pontiellaceae bacterium]|nr:group II truncated hemoglobin [Pontiellaceae bacterium]MBN2783577.1 group II truncated hemoglobin [Pontiellaceae bacterium]